MNKSTPPRQPYTRESPYRESDMKALLSETQFSDYCCLPPEKQLFVAVFVMKGTDFDKAKTVVDNNY